MHNKKFIVVRLLSIKNTFIEYIAEEFEGRNTPRKKSLANKLVLEPDQSGSYSVENHASREREMPEGSST